MKKTTLLFSLFLALFSTEAASKPRLPQFISDCMLLQRDTENRIWGWAEPGEKITVRYGWSNNPEDANLCGKNGVLASPFRTDDYPISRETGVVTDFGPGA